MKSKILMATIILINIVAVFFLFFRKTPNYPAQPDQGSAAIYEEASVSRSNEGSIGWTGDNLKNPDIVTKTEPDELGMGVDKVEIFNRDINKDSLPDRITKIRDENTTAHGATIYKIELNTGSGFIDITPKMISTIEGADCMLREYKFVFEPTFKIIEISRELKDSWVTPTMATRTEYKLSGNKIVEDSTKELREVCDVRELF